jgi:hypothetical protein
LQDIDEEFRDPDQDALSDLFIPSIPDMPIHPYAFRRGLTADVVAGRIEVLKDALHESRWGARAFTVDQRDSRSDALPLAGTDLAAFGPADICRHNYVTFPSIYYLIGQIAAVSPVLCLFRVLGFAVAEGPVLFAYFH